MSRHLYPNTAELLAFASAARHLNFSWAARELGLTPSAVSRQIATLEGLLGGSLFERHGRSLTLTQAGLRYHERIAGPLREIGNASLELLSACTEVGTLTVASVPTFTTKWLVPRLPAFLAARPGLTLSFRRHLATGDPFPTGLDAAIRYGDGHWPDMQCDYLGGNTFVPVCAPHLAATARFRQPADLAEFPRLVHEQAENAWLLWAARHGVPDMRRQVSPRFEQYAVLIQAAQAGLGLALVPDFLVADNLAAGALVQPLDAPVDLAAHGHFLCCNRDRLKTSAVLRHFREWMLRECVKSGASRAQ